MSNKKTNVDYLREIIEKNMPEDHKDEAIEFLDGIQKEYDDFSDDIKEADDESKEWEQKYDDLKGEFDALEVKIEDGPQSLQEEIVIAAFHQLVDRVGLLRVERLLDELNAAPYLS
jgi:predicted  nucleic acid-binding Zn-ribbon protein